MINIYIFALSLALFFGVLYAFTFLPEAKPKFAKYEYNYSIAMLSFLLIAEVISPTFGLLSVITTSILLGMHISLIYFKKKGIV